MGVDSDLKVSAVGQETPEKLILNIKAGLTPRTPDLTFKKNEIRFLCSSSSSQWLEEAMRENEPGSCFIFLVGTKSDLLVSASFLLNYPKLHMFTYTFMFYDLIVFFLSL